MLGNYQYVAVVKVFCRASSSFCIQTESCSHPLLIPNLYTKYPQLLTFIRLVMPGIPMGNPRLKPQDLRYLQTCLNGFVTGMLKQLIRVLLFFD